MELLAGAPAAGAATIAPVAVALFLDPWMCSVGATMHISTCCVGVTIIKTITISVQQDHHHDIGHRHMHNTLQNQEKLMQKN